MATTRWVSIHDGPHSETEFLAELLEAAKIRGRVVACPTRSFRPYLNTQLQVRAQERKSAEAWLEQAFREVWALASRPSCGTWRRAGSV